MVERADCWRSIDNAPQRAVAIFNYNVSGAMNGTRQENGGVSLWHLSLQIGETFLVTHKSEDWFYGHSPTNAEHAGVVPKSFVCLRKEIHSKQQSPIVEEATAALREWNGIFKEKYLKGENFRLTKDIMRDVMSTRSTIVSGKMTVDEEKEARKKIISKMNFLNKSLGLDLVVRDANGLVLSPDKTSVVALYRHHVESSAKQEQQLLNKPKEEVEMSNSFRILLQIMNFNPPKISEAVDLIISIYELSEAKSLKPVCENFIVKGWNKQNFEERKNTRVQFGDISKNDIANKKLYLVCNVVTEGNYNNKSSTNLTLSHDSEKKALNFRKPVGVAALDITDQFTFKQGKASQLDGGIEQELTCPYLAGSSSENESWETTFKKLVISDKKGAMENGLFVRISIKFGENLLGIGDHPIHQSAPNNRTLIAKKLGLPEVILPSDVRNDLYVNLFGGEFSRLEKRQDRNIEITVEAIASNGNIIPSCLCGGVQKDTCGLDSQYHSVVYYHDGKPRWNEVVKLEIPEDAFETTHLRFTFRHRSRNDTKEKSAPWAMSFLKLVNDEDRTAISDHSHDLVVYKLDKKFEFDKDLSYLQLPHFKSRLQSKLSTVAGLTPLPKDVFTVQTTLASTKLTQNEGLLSLLKSKSEPDNLERNLKIFDEKVESNEFVKFIPDVLDTLFSILMEHQKGEAFDQIVFKNLVKVILMITEDLKYQLFLPVLEKYIQEYFSATLAHGKILSVLKEVAENAIINPRDFSLAMKCLRYVFKFVVRSRVLFASLNKGAGREHFEENMRGVLLSLAKIMFSKIDELHQAQSNCLKHMVESIPDLITVFSPPSLSELLMQMLASLPQSHLSEEKIHTIKGIVQSPLFERQDCRSLMLPRIVDTLRTVFYEYHINTMMTNLCNETLGDILDALSKCESTSEDISQISQKCLRSVISSVANRKGSDASIQTVVANMISIFRKMKPEHYESYVKKMNVSSAAGLNDLKDFVMELLVMFKDLVQNTVFPEDWNTMIMVQNSVISKALCQVAHFIRDYLLRPFELDPWKSFFESAICFITQPFLQVEKFSETKKLKILSQYGDMRKIMGHEVHQMWINLGQHKTHFIPHLVGNILEMTLVPEKELREATIPIFFDMMQCEYYSSKNGHDLNETKRDSTIINGNFSSTEEEIVSKLDHFVADIGLGDEHYRYMFTNIVELRSNNHSFIRELGLNFVHMISKLMKILLEYRTISLQDSKENQMSCCVLLLDFYHELGRKELYVKYLKKLVVLHEQSENWAEAGFTLLQYATLLNFTNEPLFYPWKKHPQCTTQKMLKESLYKDILSNFEKGLMWESAIQICKELATLYEMETFEYIKLSELMNTMSKMYRNIVDEGRLVPEYFRVAFYGRGYPAFLQNKVFVYRGKSCERLNEFQDRMQDRFPNAELMLSLQPPTEDQKKSPHQLMQINSVDPVMVERKSFKGKEIHNNIVRYYKAHEVNIFCYSRPYYKDKDKEADVANLWIERTILTTRSAFPGILQWFPLASPPEVIELSPIDVAIETMVKTNDELRATVNEHKTTSSPSLQILTMKLNGIIDAAVNGGTAKYEQAFFSNEYVSTHPDEAPKIEELKNLIADQIPILGLGIKIHGMKRTEDLKPLHDRFEAMFKEMKSNVERKYGVRKDYPLGGFEIKADVQKETQRSMSDLSNSQSNTNHPINQTDSNNFYVPPKKGGGVFGAIRKKASTCRDEKPKIAITNNHISSQSRENSQEASSPMLRDGISRSKDNRFGSVTSCSGSRPTSGQYLQSITPNHSRSPSTTSNRDSTQSAEGSNGGHFDPPPVPPKSKSESIEETLVDPADHTLTATRKKKAPPPPPPISPPKKPPMRLIEQT